MRIERIELRRVETMPKPLVPGILYVAEKFNAVAHLCACGCGAKIRTPLGPTEWSVEETPDGPSLWPSVGNWQQACRSHYWIYRGEVRWANQWTPEQIAAGRRAEQARRQDHYDALERQREGFWGKVGRWLKSKLGF